MRKLWYEESVLIIKRSLTDHISFIYIPLIPYKVMLFDWVFCLSANVLRKKQLLKIPSSKYPGITVESDNLSFTGEYINTSSIFHFCETITTTTTTTMMMTTMTMKKLKCKCSNFVWSLCQAPSNIDSCFVWNPLVILLQLQGGR